MAVFTGIDELIVASNIIDSVALANIEILDIDSNPEELSPAGAT